MLETLLKIGTWQSQEMTEWSRFLNVPKPELTNKKGETITHYVVGIVFDLDKEVVYLDTNSLHEYDEEDHPEKLKALSIQGGNNKAIYATVEPPKLVQLFKTFFGKPDSEQAVGGELTEAIDKNFPQFQDTDFYALLRQIFSLRTQFLEKAVVDGKFDYRAFFEPLQLGRNDNLVLAFAAVKAAPLGYDTPTPIAQLATYQALLATKFLSTITEKENATPRLCYASGEFKEDVAELNLTARYSLNKMFVTETKNYASLFDKNAFSLNYQVSQANQEKLDLASSFLLDKYKTRIADVDHVIIPQFLERSNIDLDLTLEKISLDTQLLFTLQSEGSLSAGVKRIQNYGGSIFWINFLAYESDGNFFKSIGLIKDVSRFHFERLLDAFREVNRDMDGMTDTVDWNAVTTEYGKPSTFNLYLVYGLIPVRKDKEKKNIALQLFKAVLERRRVTEEQLFEHFSELMLCHYYGRYKSYTNVRAYGDDYFGLAVRDSVFKYLAFIQVLRKLNLINMESEETTTTTEEASQDHEQRINDFFERMQFSSSQKAMFYLGRILNTVVYMQVENKKNKTVIEKLNYNGMDKDDVIRLRNDLFEKAKQYNKTQNIIFNDAHFGQYFNFEHWHMNPQEALFFILTGYSFGAKKKPKNLSNHD